MKKIFLGLFAVLLILFPWGAQAQQVSGGPCIPTGILSSSAAVGSGSNSVFCGIQVISDGTNDATATVYDNASAASGKAYVYVKAPATLTPPYTGYWGPLVAQYGIYVSLSGSNATYIVWWR